jgi:protein TonB
MVRFRLVALALSAVICALVVWAAASHRITGILEEFTDTKAITVVKKEKEPEKPPPPPPPQQKLPPPPPIQQRETPVVADVPPVETDLPVAPAPSPPPPAPPAPPAPPRIDNPQWIERPTGRDFERFYPPRALEREREGRVVLDCTVRADGRISCAVASEDPPNWGFGEAAVKISQSFKMSPRLENGQPSEGGRVRVPITFRLS